MLIGRATLQTSQRCRALQMACGYCHLTIVLSICTARLWVLRYVSTGHAYEQMHKASACVGIIHAWAAMHVSSHGLG